ncbi:Transcriptional regulator, TrmB [candidate division SR1 bacterium RAAC1_SR1_1]|nr:Transcriptional regulator, TrmB [candidate division SR1 bacterium RAAC1_SR1_1]
METNLLITLQNYGFSEKEAKVYLTVLELGTSIASTIARRSEIKRVTVYTILDDLKRKGIANETTKDDVKFYSVISPDILLKQLEQKFESFKEKVPELLALAEKFGNKTRIQFFEGLEGMKKVYAELLTSKDHSIRSFLGSHEAHPVLRDYLNEHFVPQRVKYKIKAKVICCESEDNKSYHKVNKKNLIEVKFIKDDIFKLSCGIDIYAGNKVSIVLFSKEEMSGLIVTSKRFHDTLASIFDFIWVKK